MSLASLTMDGTAMSDQMTSLLQHHQAQQLMNTYTAYVDSRNYEAMESIAHPDIVLVRNSGTEHGRDSFVDLYRSFASSDVLSSQHMTTNIQVRDQADGSLAVTAPFLAITTHPDTGARYTWGRYEDEMAEHNGTLVFTAKRIRITRTALIPEEMLEPEGASTFETLSDA